MKRNESRKELLAKYKEREVVGGVYVIKNTMRDKSLLQATIDLQASKNRFEFAQKMNTCIEKELQKDWSIQKGEHFIFEALETLKKKEEQTLEEFKEDVNILREMWLEKYGEDELY
ncbi:MAG: GIY-YIG nuclease family protein [Bacillota bacterium]